MKPQDPIREKRTLRSWLNPANIFLVLGLIFGITYCVFIPFNAGFDEETHLARVFEMAGLHFVPNSTGENGTASVPSEFFRLSYQRRYFQTPAFDLYKPDKFFMKINWSDLVHHETRSIYSPVNFLPQTVVASLGWYVFKLPVIPVAIASRLAGMLAYVLAVYLAIRWLPYGKWVMIPLGLAPMALFQVSTITSDGYNILIDFLFIAAVFKLHWERPAPISTKWTWGLVVLSLGLGLAKPGAFFLCTLGLVLIPRKFELKHGRLVLLMGVILGILLTVGWSNIALSHSLAVEGSIGNGFDKASLILADPFRFTLVIFNSIATNFGRYWQEWIGVYGHWLGSVPQPVYWLFPLGLLAVIFSDKPAVKLNWRDRLIFLAIFLLNFLIVVFLLTFLYYDGTQQVIGGVQGRYFVPLTPLLFLALVGLVPMPERFLKFFQAGAVAIPILVLGLYSFGMAATYYTNCWSSLYTNAACVQPIYKNLDKAGAPEIEINQKTSVSQTFLDVCGTLDSALVWVKRVSDQPQGNLRATVLDDTGKAIGENILPVAKVEREKYLIIPIQPNTGTKLKTYTLRLESTDIPEGQGVVIGTSKEPEYENGKLTVNDSARDVDLIFRYSCPSSINLLR